MFDYKDIDLHSPAQSDSKDDYTEVYAWGDNQHGQLGLGKEFPISAQNNLTPFTCSFSLIIKEISCGEEHAAFLTNKGHIYTMGSNQYGNLGIGNKNVFQSSSPCQVEACLDYKCVQISCGLGHTVALMSDGEIFAWGMGEYGALGTGKKNSHWSPTQIFLNEKFPLGAVKVSAGGRHTGFISEQGNAYVCGSGESGQLGTGICEKEVLSPVQVEEITEKLKDIACGSCHTLFLTESGRIYATGNNKYGQLGLGMKRSICIPMPIRSLEAQKITKISCWNHSACLTAKGELYIWGTGVFGEYLNPVRFSKGGIVFKELSVGNFFGAAIENNGRLWVWGSNTGGELGLGDYDSRVTPVLNEHLKSKKGWKLSCGGNFVIVLGEIIKRRRVLSSTSPLRVTTGNFGEEGLYKTPQRKPFENIEQKIEPSAVLRTSLEDIIPIKSLIQNRSDGRSLFDENRTSRREGLIGRSTGRGRNTGREFIGTLKRSLERGERISDVDLSEVRKRENLLGEQKYIDLLEKQKEVLEKSLKYEREDKKELEKIIESLKEELENATKGSGPFGNNEEIDDQDFNEDFREKYEQEALNRKELEQTLSEEQTQRRKLKDKIKNQEEIIEELRKNLERARWEVEGRIDRFEDLHRFLEEEKNRNEALNEERLAVEAEVIKLREENEERRTFIDKSEEFRELYLEENKKYRREKDEYERRIKELSDNLAQSRKELDRESQTRKTLQGELEKNKERFQEAQNEIKLLLKEKDRLLHQLRGGNQSFQEGFTNNDDDDDERTSTKREISGFGDYERKWREPLERGSEEKPKFDFKLYNENNNDRFDHSKGLRSSIESFRQKFERENEDSGLGLTRDRGYEDEREWRLNSESERRGKQELTFRDEDESYHMAQGEYIN